MRDKENGVKTTNLSNEVTIQNDRKIFKCLPIKWNKNYVK